MRSIFNIVLAGPVVWCLDSPGPLRPSLPMGLTASGPGQRSRRPKSKRSGQPSRKAPGHAAKATKAVGLLPHRRLPAQFHSAIEQASRIVGRKDRRYQATLSQSYADLQGDRLKQFDAVFFNNTCRMKTPEPVKKALMEYIQSGHGFPPSRRISRMTTQLGKHGPRRSNDLVGGVQSQYGPVAES